MIGKHQEGEGNYLDLLLSGAQALPRALCMFIIATGRRRMKWFMQEKRKSLTVRHPHCCRVTNGSIRDFIFWIWVESCETFSLLCSQLTNMNLANRILRRESLTLNPRVQNAAGTTQGPVKAVHSGTALCGGAGWVQRYRRTATNSLLFPHWWHEHITHST